MKVLPVVPATLGLVLVLSGAAVRAGDAGDVIKPVLVSVFQFLTAPLAAHALARGAYRFALPAERFDRRPDAEANAGQSNLEVSALGSAAWACASSVRACATAASVPLGADAAR